MLSKEQAIELLKMHVKNDKLIKHCLAVAKIMQSLAHELKENEELWYLTGILHDLDYEKTKENMKEHGIKSAEILVGKLPEQALLAIKAHNEMTGYKPESKLALALRASDAVSGLIIATALVMPDKKLASIKVESLKNKFKQKDFARNVRRDNILLCEKLGISLEKFLEISLNALKEISSELGL
ncbi:MAG TPA: HDIG domain-containing protein [Nanoarchaeota archaeon]|nr:HDIG domain-containing protein [Nanoarchaeota archaeon]